jgi:hypothetical protein
MSLLAQHWQQQNSVCCKSCMKYSKEGKSKYLEVVVTLSASLKTFGLKRMHMSFHSLTCHYLYLEDVLMRYSCIIAGVSGSFHNTRLHLDIEEVTTIWAWVSTICSLMATAWVLCSSFYYWNGLSLCCLPGTWSKLCLLAQASAATGYSPSNRAPAGEVFILERDHGHTIIHSTQSFFFSDAPLDFLARIEPSLAIFHVPYASQPPDNLFHKFTLIYMPPLDAATMLQHTMWA